MSVVIDFKDVATVVINESALDAEICSWRLEGKYIELTGIICLKSVGMETFSEAGAFVTLA